MVMINARRALGRIILFDAASCAAMGLLLMLSAGTVAGLTAIPAMMLFQADVYLLLVALYALLVALKGTGSPAAVWLLILGNIAWVFASFVLFAFVSPNLIGTVFILAQALVVAMLARLEHAAWRGNSLLRHSAS